MAEYSFPHVGVDGSDLLEESGPLVAVEITVPLKLKRFHEEQGLAPYSTRSGFALIDTGAGGSGSLDWSWLRHKKQCASAQKRCAGRAFLSFALAAMVERGRVIVNGRLRS